MHNASAPAATGAAQTSLDMSTSGRLHVPHNAVNFFSRLAAVRQIDSGWIARCPAHEDRNPSLSVSLGPNGRILICCHAGCSFREIAAAVGLGVREFGPDRPASRGPIRRSSGATKPSVLPPAAAPLGTYWTTVAENAVAAISSRRLEFLAAQLGVSSQSLAQLRVGWSFKHGAFTVPEVDGERRIIGVALRWPTGRKGFIRQGMRGLTVPATLQRDGRVFVVEGMSDVAALSDHGIAAVGRPSASGGIGHLASLLADREIVVVGEHDRKPD